MPDQDDDRREFLKTCGKFAAVTPPAITLLLSTSLTSDAIAHSGAGAVHHDHHEHHHGNNGWAMVAAMAVPTARTIEAAKPFAAGAATGT
ncbi:hypothetical protein [Bradyrhizobium sp. 87]|uniref:hypothetical protein n=1 Tax=Bradyrhizobium sp. 87 TaxID=2782682 RepID=UPI001FF8FA17|nr:hypothetical protein [Bradyrhizobium sp. 87]